MRAEDHDFEYIELSGGSILFIHHQSNHDDIQGLVKPKMVPLKESVNNENE